MRLRDTAERYGLVAILNHWVLALVMVGLVATGLVATYLAGEELRSAIVYPHKAIGVLVPMVAIWLALWWSFQPRRPGAVPGTSGFGAALRATMHVFLVIGTVVMSLSGVAMATFKGRAIDVFGLFVVPGQEEVPWLASAARDVHEIGGWAMVVAILGHGAVALKHHMLDRDPTFARMLGRSA